MLNSVLVFGCGRIHEFRRCALAQIVPFASPSVWPWVYKERFRNTERKCMTQDARSSQDVLRRLVSLVDPIDARSLREGDNWLAYLQERAEMPNHIRDLLARESKALQVYLPNG